MNKNIITIEREYASGGKAVGQELAHRLGVPCYDREIISKAARESGLADSYIKELSKQKTISFLYNIYMSSQDPALPTEIFDAESEVIRRLASEGPCVFVGRCAGQVLKEEYDPVTIFMHAPLQMRIDRAVREYHIQESDPESFVLRKDNSRSSYYSNFTMKKWGDYVDYDMILDTSIGIDAAADVVEFFVKGRTNNA